MANSYKSRGSVLERVGEGGAMIWSVSAERSVMLCKYTPTLCGNHDTTVTLKEKVNITPPPTPHPWNYEKSCTNFM